MVDKHSSNILCNKVAIKIGLISHHRSKEGTMDSRRVEDKSRNTIENAKKELGCTAGNNTLQAIRCSMAQAI